MCVCATNMMVGPLRLNLTVWWDLSHGVHNDVDLAFHSSDLWLFMLLFVVVANVPCAPWNENKRWQQARSVMDNFYARVRPQDCPLFLSMLAPLMDELGCGAEVLSSASPEAALWNFVHDASPWQWKDEKLQVSRFLGMVQRAGEEAQRAHRRLLACLLACLELDYLHGPNFNKVQVTSAPTAPETAG